MYRRVDWSKASDFIRNADSRCSPKDYQNMTVVWYGNCPYTITPDQYEGYPTTIRSVTQEKAQELTGAWRFDESELPR